MASRSGDWYYACSALSCRLRAAGRPAGPHRSSEHVAVLCVVIGLIFFESLIPFSVFSLPPGPVGRCWVPGRRPCARRAVQPRALLPRVTRPGRACS